MKSETAIIVESLSKTYRLYGSHRDRMKEFFHPLRKRYHTKHHALKNISFTLQKGEVLGVIGHNGSGKSTLLKILASVVSPSSGHYSCNGRVTALLELGGGFNDEMTGVENIYFIGALQGFRKKEMKKRVEAILDFAEVGEYAYQPVKSYSSGMYVRLAFSMNININPDILIIDEALSVGDMRFQQKCFRKIKEIKEAGKTILLCSHSLSAVKDFCTRAIWINRGCIEADGDPIAVTDMYQAFMAQADTIVKVAPKSQSDIDFSEIFNVPIFKRQEWIDLTNYQWSGDGKVQIHYAALVNPATNESITKAEGGKLIEVVCIIYATEQIDQPGFQLTLHGQFGVELFKFNTLYYGQNVNINVGKPTLLVAIFTFPDLANGNYTFSFAITQAIEGRQEFLYSIPDGLIVTVDNPHPAYKLGTQLAVADAHVINLTASDYLHL